MDSDETEDDSSSCWENAALSSNSTKVVLSLDCVEAEIETYLKEKLSLKEVICEFEKKFGRNLSDVDYFHVEDKYIDLLINCWLEEVLHLVSIGFDPKHPLKFLEVLNIVNNFSDCVKFFGTSNTYNVVICDLSEISTSLKSREKECIYELKKICYNDILNRTSGTKDEMMFVNDFLGALKRSQNVSLVCHLFEVYDFLQSADKVGFKILLSNVLHKDFSCTKLIKLQNSARRIYSKNEYDFIEDLRNMIVAYLEPVVIKESNADGRLLLEVSGKHIVMSNELDKIEKSLSFSYVEEVRFVGAGVIHIDADLSRAIWHGKNIVVYGETLIVSREKSVVWDVSGKDADFTSINEAAGTSEDGCGLKGEDGSPGESGGNVCILVESIENCMNFKIVSNGGKGSKGQNGGPGKDGKDGEFIDPYKFKEDFPPVSHLQDKEKNYKKTMDSVCQNLLSVDKLHYGLNEFNITKTQFEVLIKKNTDLNDIYFETTTEEGCKIKFSFYNEDTWSCCQSFLLHKGALGTEGKIGGAGGCGGKGGFAGDVKIQATNYVNIFTSEHAKSGTDGEMGISGRSGKPGKNGLDRGYMDCTLALFHSLFYSVKWPKVFIPGPRDNNRLTVKYYSEKKPDRVKCPYNGLYAEITQITRSEHIDQLSQNNYAVLKKHEHQEVYAKRKKNISQKSIKDQYKEKDSVWNTYNTENILETVQGELEELINQTSKETEKITQEAKITRQISYGQQNDWYLEEIKYDVNVENEDIVSSTKLAKWKIPGPFSLLAKTDSQTMQPSHGHSTSLITTIHEQSSIGFETDSLLKYHLDALEYLYYTISLDHISENSNIKSQVTNSKFLEEAHTVVGAIDQKQPSHPIEQFFCRDSITCRQEIVRISSDYSLVEEPLDEALKIFIHEPENDNRHKTVIELGKHCCNFNQLKDLKLREKLLPLKHELVSQTKNKQLYNHLINGLLNQSAESKVLFEDKITQDKFLNYLYKSFVHEMKKTFDWELEHFKTNVLHIFQGYIMDKGPFGTSCREFLAQHFDVNILLYTLNSDDNKFVLVSNHNPKAESRLHFLLKRNKFVKLNFDYEFSRLFEKYKYLANVLDKIMLHLCSFTEKQQISDYISKREFISDHSSTLGSSDVVGIKINHILNQENYVKSISNSYLSQMDAIRVKCRLDKLKAEFIGYENILHYMALHFEVEGNQTTASELCFVVNQILKFSIEESKVMSSVSWIIAAQPQQLWILELALLKLELHFKSPLNHETKCKWREYIENQTEKASLMMFLKKLDSETCHISVDSLDELLYLMGNVPKAHIGLENINLSEWKYYLKDRFWAHQLKSITNWSEEQLKTLSFYLVTWENLVGIDLCFQLVCILKEHANEINTELDKDFVLTIVKSLNSKEVCFNNKLWSMLSTNTLTEWQKVIDNESINTVLDRTLQQLLKLIENCGNTSSNIVEILPSIESTIEVAYSVDTSLKYDFSENELKKLFSGILNPNKSENSVLLRIKSLLAELTPNENTFDKTLNVLLDIIKSTTKENMSKSSSSNFKRGLSKSNDQYIIDLCTKNMFLPLIELCIKLKHNKCLRNTQKLTAMTLLMNAKNTLAQVSTGEGKSLIVVAVAIIKALSNEKVNIITSSKVLARRDANMYRDIYELCGLTVGHNCSDNIEERKKVYSNCQVIYGELANFQRDYLLDRVYNKNILGDCSFETVIVDEVDSMLLDKGNNVLYLSHEIPGLDKIEPVFIYIWKWISRPIPYEQFEDLFSVQTIKDKIMYDIFGVIKKENIKQLDTSMSEKQVDRSWECLIENEVIDHHGKILKENVNSCNIDGFPEGCVPKIHLKYILEKVINREQILHIPQYLHSFVEDHLESWIKSAISAMVMESGSDYIVDVDRSETVSDRNPIITILDRDTGTDLINSQWDDGLHQFLQLKHGCKLSLLSLKAVFISNVSYLKLYKTLYGLTGTLGSTFERELLKEVYDVDFVTIPTAKAKKFSEEPSILCSTAEEWKQNIYEEVCRILSKQRSALIICETIKEVFILKEKFTPHFRPELIHTYTRDYEGLSVTDNLQPGYIIISTNLAGRGTDIKLSKQLIDNGGLYVCVTFLPSNCRVEEQAYGRAARNGEPGTAQLIFRTTRQSASHSTAKVIDVKKQRDINELKRLTEIKSYHETQIDQEEKWFGKFTEVYCNLIKKMEQDKDIKHILLQAFLNEWAFWLDKNKKLLFSTSSSSEDICSSLEHFISDWAELERGELENWVKLVADPTQLVKLGLAYLKKRELSSSLLLFKKVIEEETYFSEIAHYYKVCVTVQQQDLTNLDILEPLKVVAQKLKQRAESSQMSALEINWLREQDNKNLIQIDSFLDQQTNISKIYEVILQSVNSILGSEIFPEIFIIPGQIEKHVAKEVYNSIINAGLITKQEIKSNIKSEELLFAKDYGLSQYKLKLFLSKFEGKEYQEQRFLESFEKECVVPSRETFWKELLKCHALINEENYVFIDMQELRFIHPSLSQRIEPKLTKPNSMPKMKIWLYQPEELLQMKDCKTLSFVKQDELIEMIGSNMYRLLEKKDILTSNKLATFDPTKLLNPLNLDNFDVISYEDFQTINICEETASKIIKDLVNQHIIQEKSSTYPRLYCLSIDAERIEHIELTTLKAYTYEVRSLMSVCFAFRIAFAKLKLHNMETCEKICLPLRVGLHKRMALELKDKELIKKTYVDTNEDVSKTLDELYPKSMNKDGYKKLFVDILCDTSCDAEIDMLIKSKWLVKETAIGLFKPQDETYYINSRIKSPLDSKKNNHSPKEGDDKLQPTLLPFHSEKETIIKTILNRLHLIEQLDFVKNILTSSRGHYLSFDTPTFSLSPLLDVLIEKELSGEFEIFSLNGFDQLIVLEEKKWTLKTKCNILCVVTAGVCQIAFGVVMQALFPVNSISWKFIAEGMNDLVFGVSCLYTGHCSFKNYLLNKVVSMATTWSFQLCSWFRSGFGQKVSGMSFQSIRQGFAKALGRLSTTSTLKTVTKNCSVKIVTAISRGLMYGAVDHVIQSQLDKISLAITEGVYSNINETVDNHSVINQIKEMCITFGPADSKRTMSICFSKHIESSKDMLNKSLSSTVSLVLNLIRLSWSHFKRSTDKTSETTGLDFLEIFKVCQNVLKAIEECHHLFEKFIKQINSLLDAIEGDLIHIVSNGKKDSRSPILTSEDLKFFSFSICDDWKKGIKSQLSDCLNKNLLSPVLQSVTNYLVDSSSRLILVKSKNILRTDEVRKKNVSDYKCNQAKTKKKSKFTSDESEYEECLLDLLKKKRNVAIFTEILRKNVTVDTNFIEMCCFVLPKALKSEGVVLPNLEIIIERNGTYQRFSTTDEKCQKTTIIIAPDSNIATNVFKNKTLIKCGVDLILTKIAQDSPELGGLPLECLRLFVAEKIERAFETQTHIPTTEVKFYCTNTYSKINASAEYKVPYQHFHVNGKYVFNMNVDVDLRKDENLSSLSLIEDHIFNGFICALNKINNHIHNVQDHLPNFKLSLEDFEKMNYDIVPQSNRALKGNFHCFATHYKLVMPFVVDFNERHFEDFTVTMTLNNQASKSKPYSPGGPHITYEINPNVHFKFVNKGTKGHVLINKECSEYSFSAENCHIAGDLILPTGFEFQKPCKVLMLGDCMFSAVSEVSSFPNYVAISYSNFSSLKLAIANLTMAYKGIQCVVLIPGNPTSSAGMSAGEVTSKISEVIEESLGKFAKTKTKIAVCSLLKAKGVAVGKVTQINKCLKMHCSRMKINFLETNSFISSDDLEDNGIHLNKRGLTKILQCVL